MSCSPEKFLEIQTQLLADIKSADMRYSTECAKHGVRIQDSVQQGMVGLTRIVIANGFAYQTAKMVQNHMSDLDPNTVFTKEEFLKLAGAVYEDIHDKCKELVTTVQQQLATLEAKEAVKN